MIERFKTKRDINGNTYTLTIDHTTKTFNRNYNLFDMSDFIQIGKRDRQRIIKELQTAGYTER